MSLVYFLCGIPYSGKTKFGENSFDQFDYNYISGHAIAEKIGTMCGEDISVVHDELTSFIKRQVERDIKYAISRNRKIVIDDLNIFSTDRKILLDLFIDSGYRKTIYVFPHPTKDYWDSRENLAKRKRSRDYYLAEFQMPTLEEGFDEVRHYHGGI
jgi:predicted kinase